MIFFLGRLLGRCYVCFWGVWISKGPATFWSDFPVAVLRLFSHNFQIPALKEKVPLLSHCLSAVLCLLRWPSALVASIWLHLLFQLFSLRFDSCKLIPPLEAFRYIRMMHPAKVAIYPLVDPYLPTYLPSLPRRWNFQNAWKVQRRWTPDCIRKHPENDHRAESHVGQWRLLNFDWGFGVCTRVQYISSLRIATFALVVWLHDLQPCFLRD